MDQQIRALEEAAQSRISFCEGGINEGRAGDQQEVGAACKVREDALHGGAQESLCAIAPHGASHGPPGRDSHSWVGLAAGLRYQHNKRVGIRFSKPPHPLEIG